MEGETIEFMSTLKALDSVLLVVQQTAIVLSLSVQRGALVINLTRRYWPTHSLRAGARRPKTDGSESNSHACW